MITPDAVLRDVLSRFDRAIVQVRRIGVNLNQAVAALNATGQPGRTARSARPQATGCCPMTSGRRSP